MGVEPSAELREIGYSKGLSRNQLIDGDAMNLAFGASPSTWSASLARCITFPSRPGRWRRCCASSEKAIFISDSNNFGQGGRVPGYLKQAINAAGLWPLADRIKTRGKG